MEMVVNVIDRYLIKYNVFFIIKMFYYCYIFLILYFR